MQVLFKDFNSYSYDRYNTNNHQIMKTKDEEKLIDS